ncbi:MAG: TRAP transporter large permease subunit [Verrucomicrobiota bacterium]
MWSPRPARVVEVAGLLVGGVLLILGWRWDSHYLVDEQIPDRVVAWSTEAIGSKWLFLLGLNFVLIAVGGLIEVYAAISVVVPLLVPVGVAFGIDPIHLGILFLANRLGFLAPPSALSISFWPLTASARLFPKSPERRCRCLQGLSLACFPVACINS